MTPETDRERFAALVRLHQERLQRYAARLLGGDADAAADVVQDAFVKLWPRPEVWRDPSQNPAGWLVRAVQNRCCDLSRRVRHDVETDPVDPRPGPESAALAAAVRDAVTALTEPQKSVFILSYYEGLRYDEIAALLEIPPGTVASRKSAAVATLRRKLEEWIL